MLHVRTSCGGGRGLGGEQEESPITAFRLQSVYSAQRQCFHRRYNIQCAAAAMFAAVISRRARVVPIF
jgi:hypothetical protein